jgi:LIVCS family branched-chain amino acid:cation transporter
LSTQTLGTIGTSFLSVLVALACFTTGVGIVTGASDYVKGVFNNSKVAYTITAVVSCILGILIGQFDVHFIIDVALPALMFIYPITIVLILLNVLPKKWSSVLVFRGVVIAAFVFSIPDFLKFFVPEGSLTSIQSWVPLSSQGLGWVIPSAIAFVVMNLVQLSRKDIATI